MTRITKLRERYGAHVLLAAAVLLAIVIPQEVRNAAWSWLIKGINVMDVIVVVGGFRLMSNVEHRKTLLKIAGIGDQLDNGIKERLGRIERKLDLEERKSE